MVSEALPSVLMFYLFRSSDNSNHNAKTVEKIDAGKEETFKPTKKKT